MPVPLRGKSANGENLSLPNRLVDDLMTSQINGLKKKVCDQAFVFEHRASKRELNIADGKKMRF